MPYTARSQRASAAPVVPTNNGQHNDRPYIEPGDLCVGCILWLPQNAQSTDSNIKCNKVNCCGRALEDGGYEHPIVVLSIKQKPGSRIPGDIICTVACITTFRDTLLPKYLIKRRDVSHYQSSIPILDPTTSLIDRIDTQTSTLVEQLHVESRSLRKQSYVTFQHTYSVPSSSLCHYDFRARRAYNPRLKQASYELLMQKVNLEAEKYIPTLQLSATKEERLNALAGIIRLNWTPAPTSPTTPSSRETPYRTALLGTAPSSSYPHPQNQRTYQSAPIPVPVPLPPPPSSSTPYRPTNHLYNSIPAYYGSITPSETPRYHSHARPYSSHSRSYGSIETGNRSENWDRRWERRDGEGEGEGEVATFWGLLAVAAVGVLLWWQFW